MIGAIFIFTALFILAVWWRKPIRRKLRPMTKMSRMQRGLAVSMNSTNPGRRLG